MTLFRLFILLLLSVTTQAQTVQDSLDKVIKDLRDLASADPGKATEGFLKAKKKAHEIQYDRGIMQSSYTLMLLYYNGGDYGKVIEESRCTATVATKLRSNQYLADVHRMKGIAYDEMGLGKEALIELDKALVYTGKIENQNKRFYKTALLNESYAGVFNKERDFDKEIDYRKKSLEESFKMTEDDVNERNAKYHNVALQYASLGLAYKELNKRDSAIWYFEKAQSIYEDSKYDIYPNGRATLLSDMALFYVENKEYRKSIALAKKAEHYEKQTSLPYIRRNIYRSLFDSYSEISKGDSAKYYLDLYTSINDSLLKVEKENLYTPVNQIILDKEIEKKQHVWIAVVLAGIVSVILLLIGWMFWKKKNQNIKKTYEMLVEKLKYNAPLSDKSIDYLTDLENDIDMADIGKGKSLKIADDTLNLLLKKLDKFEKSEAFLKKDINLNYLANLLGFNHRYVSEAIKNRREKTFSNYINDLRIDHIIKLLYNDLEYRKYKISYLAEVSGFSSREVFATAFKKRTGIPPSYFIENLSKDN